jgi:hypothetical protein
MLSKSHFASSSLLALSLAVATAAASGCAGDDAVGANGELGARLATPMTLAIVPPSHAAISGRTEAGAAVDVGPLAIEGGTISAKVDANGDLVLSDFVVDLGDIVADSGTLAAAPRILTDVHVSLGRQIVLHDAWSTTGASARATVYGKLRLDWSIVDENGQAVPLAAEVLEDVELNVNLRAEDDGSVSARLSSMHYGRVFADWGIQLSDFQMEVSATAK